MKKLAFSLLFTGTFLGLFLNASDFKSMNNQQLLEQAGKVALLAKFQSFAQKSIND